MIVIRFILIVIRFVLIIIWFILIIIIGPVCAEPGTIVNEFWFLGRDGLRSQVDDWFLRDPLLRLLLRLLMLAGGTRVTGIRVVDAGSARRAVDVVVVKVLKC